jgi:hypothetical protein
LARARSFGGATAGVPTANAPFPLPDGASLYLMVALDADRNGNWYSTRIFPDQPIFLSTYPATDDAVVTAAMAWLATRPSCVIREFEGPRNREVLLCPERRERIDARRASRR